MKKLKLIVRNIIKIRIIPIIIIIGINIKITKKSNIDIKSLIIMIITNEIYEKI